MFEKKWKNKNAERSAVAAAAAAAAKTEGLRQLVYPPEIENK